MRHADGSWRWFQGRDTVFERNEQGHVRLAIGTATDITAIKVAEVTLRENNQRLDFVLTAANMGVWELNLDTGTIASTEPLTRLLGVAPEEAPKVFDEFLQLIHPDEREHERRKIKEAVANKSMYQSEFRIALRNGSVRWVATLAKILGGEEGKSPRLLGLMWDISKRKQADAERRQMEEQIRQSQKMEALGGLAGGIAHDFNNILTAINGNARLALHDLPNDDAIRTNLDEISRAAKRATDLVSRILAFSRNEEPALRPVDMRAVVEEAIRLLRATMPAMIEIRFDAPAAIPQVFADATQIHQVIMNLGSNARDAMSTRGGVLTIALGEVPLDGRLTMLAPEIRGQACLCLTVEDTGVGITPENLDRIFEPFFTTKAPGHGTGMGLAMVHGIVRRHGGVILASSHLGRGTKFEMYFPGAPSIDAEPATAKPPAVCGHGERILYVDDEEPLVFLASRMLTRIGFHVDGRTDPKQALREFERDPYRWDMVISDLGMPGMSGLDLAAELLRIRPDVPLMLTSGYVRLEDAERARMLGAQDIVLKPNTVEEMAPIIVSRLAAARDREAVPPPN
jgi:PAS domain S-box-containing protein